MWKKSISMFILTSFLSMLFFSCSEDTVVGHNLECRKYVEITEIAESMKIEIQDLGVMHTEVLTAFNNRHPFINGGNLHIEEYLAISVESINSVLASRNIRQRVTDADVIEVLNEFIKLRDSGVADLFNISEVVPVTLYNYAVEQRILLAEEAEQYISVLEELKKESEREGKIIPIKELSISCDTSNPVRDITFIDFIESSGEFWDHIITIAYADSTEGPIDIDIDKLNSVMLIYWDASWALIGGLVGGLYGAFVGIMIASTVFVIWGDDLMGGLYDMF